MASNHIFKIIFVNQGRVYEVYARKVSHGALFGFVEVEELVFGDRSSVVVDPGEDPHLVVEFYQRAQSRPLQNEATDSRSSMRLVKSAGHH